MDRNQGFNMDRNQGSEVELYEENVGNLNYSTPTESRSSSPDRFLPVLSSQEPIQRLEENPFVAIDPRPDSKELSHAPTSQVPRIHDSCHIYRQLIKGQSQSSGNFQGRIQWCHCHNAISICSQLLFRPSFMPEVVVARYYNNIKTKLKLKWWLIV